MSSHEAVPLLPELRARIERLIGGKVRTERVVTAGYSATERWVVNTDRSSLFVKVGSPPVSEANLRHEARVYERLRLSCMPQRVAWEDDISRPLLILEDLSGADWPPPWNAGSLERVLQELEAMHATSGGLESYEQRHGAARSWWTSIAQDPTAFLSLGLRTRVWFDSNIRTLVELSDSVSPAGRSVCHFDLRSDNVCLSRERVTIIDWSLACLGNPRVDLGLFLPGLVDEGGPLPEAVLPGAPEIAAWVSGFFAFYASKPFIPSAPRVRAMQRQHLLRALEWAERELRA